MENNLPINTSFAPVPGADNANNQPVVQVSASENAALAMAAQQKAVVEARYMMAMARPRDYDKVRQAMLKDANRTSFAKVAIYHKPIGNGVEGPSIRFVEGALRAMTNVLTETNTISEDDERRVVRVSVTDLETNTYYSTDVTVTKTVEKKFLPQGEKPIRIRTNSNGKPVYILHATDDEILNKQNALISKAVRTLGLRIIPGDLVDETLMVARQTMAREVAQNPDAAKNNLVDAFCSLGVPVEALKDYVGHELSTLSPAEIQSLRGTWQAIRDGETTWQAVVDNKKEKAAESSANEKKKSSAKKAEAPAKKEEPVQEAAPAESESEVSDDDMFA